MVIKGDQLPWMKIVVISFVAESTCVYAPCDVKCMELFGNTAMRLGRSLGIERRVAPKDLYSEGAPIGSQLR